MFSLSNGDAVAQVSGWVEPDDAGADSGTGDIVGMYGEAASLVPVATCAATYDSGTQVTVASADVDANRLRKGMWLLTEHDTPYKSILVSWTISGDNVVMTTTGWREVGTANTGQDDITPASGSDIIVNASTKVWTVNLNNTLSSTGLATKASAAEIDLVNNKRRRHQLRGHHRLHVGLGRCDRRDEQGQRPISRPRRILRRLCRGRARHWVHRLQFSGRHLFGPDNRLPLRRRRQCPASQQFER
jgi:hypothetical protein